MEKIIVALNAVADNKHLLDFSCYITRLTKSRLYGFFFDTPFAEADLQLKEDKQKVVGNQAVSRKSSTGPSARIVEQVRLLEDACNSRDTNGKFHYLSGTPLEEIIDESRFADLLILDADLDFVHESNIVPSPLVRNILQSAECPVVIAAHDFSGIDEVFFAFDGSASSVFAIKQFTYLFPELSDKKITVIQVDEKGDTPFIPKDRIGELLQLNYSSIGFRLLHGKPGEELFKFLLGKEKAIVVMGAFGHTMFSSFFRRKSSADLVIKVINLPVFIAHH